MSEEPAIRPTPREVLLNPVHCVAFGFGAGLSPRAPGTVGTLVGIPFWWALSWLPLAWYLAAVAALFAFGCWVCDRSAKRLGVHDYGGIVFDEVIGYLVACLPLAINLEAWRPGIVDQHWNLDWNGIPALVVVFVLFRLFDIWKPWPIGGFDRRVGGGFGIMLDDLIAGLYAALVLYAGFRLMGLR